MKKQIIFIIIIVALIGISSVLFAINENKTMENEELINQYQGPVPEGYNETHYRRTGKTILNKDTQLRVVDK